MIRRSLKSTCVFIIFCLPFLSGCSTNPEASSSPALISNFVEAFNNQDADAMLAMSHEDIEWIYVSGSDSNVASTGREAMRKDLEAHFASPFKVTSSLSSWVLNGQYVSTKETASWIDKDGNDRQQASIAVYQLDDNLIRRVWYYPEQK